MNQVVLGSAEISAEALTRSLRSSGHMNSGAILGGAASDAGQPDRVLHVRLFPNQGLSLFPEAVRCTVSSPLAPDRTAVVKRVYLADPDTRHQAAADYLLRRLERRRVAESTSLCRGCQDALRSIAYPAIHEIEPQPWLPDLHRRIKKVLPVSRLAVEPGSGAVAAVNASMTT